jgi:hypothetical protein
MRLMLAVLLMIAGCQSPEAKRRAAFEQLCPRINELVCSGPALKSSLEDRATLVVGSLSEQRAEYGALFSGVSKVDPARRLQLIKDDVAKEVGHRWECPAWDATWHAQDGCAVARGQ